MNFATFEFLHLFLPLALLGDLGLRRLRPSWPRWLWLLGMSWLFYAWERTDHLTLILASTGTDFLCGRAAASGSRARRNLALGLSLAVNLGLLAWFKYANLAAESAQDLIAAAGGAPFVWESIVLPVGISFYTFQTLSYTIDVWRGDVTPAKSPLAFATYVALFPQLVAGPIVRWKDLQPDFEGQRRRAADFGAGAVRFSIGLAKKVLIADHAALLADAAFGAESPGFGLAWVGALAYAVQIYYDFSGYSDMAIGIGRMLGFRFPENFDQPYRSASVTEFWRRWHITLSTWLRDYLYIPLGGNRKGSVRTGINLALVMLLGGLWHGAAWTFVLWGALHGLALAAERVGRARSWLVRLPRSAGITLTFLFAVLAWVPFRAVGFEESRAMLAGMFGLATRGEVQGVANLALLPKEAWLGGLIGLTGLWLLPSTQVLMSQKGSRAVLVALWAGVALTASLAFVAWSGQRPFLYFQF